MFSFSFLVILKYNIFPLLFIHFIVLFLAVLYELSFLTITKLPFVFSLFFVVDLQFFFSLFFSFFFFFLFFFLFIFKFFFISFYSITTQNKKIMRKLRVVLFLSLFTFWLSIFGVVLKFQNVSRSFIHLFLCGIYICIYVFLSIIFECKIKVRTWKKRQLLCAKYKAKWKKVLSIVISFFFFFWFYANFIFMLFDLTNGRYDEFELLKVICCNFKIFVINKNKNKIKMQKMYSWNTHLNKVGAA